MSRTDSKRQPLACYVVAIPLLALVLMWINHVWAQWPIAYWQWLAISVPVIITPETIKYPMRVLVTGALLGQVLGWVGLITLPIFHVSVIFR